MKYQVNVAFVDQCGHCGSGDAYFSYVLKNSEKGTQNISGAQGNQSDSTDS